MLRCVCVFTLASTCCELQNCASRVHKRLAHQHSPTPQLAQVLSSQLKSHFPETLPYPNSAPKQKHKTSQTCAIMMFEKVSLPFPKRNVQHRTLVADGRPTEPVKVTQILPRKPCKNSMLKVECWNFNMLVGGSSKLVFTWARKTSCCSVCKLPH